MMTLFKLIIVAAVIYGGYTYWQKHNQTPVEIAVTSENGFVPLPPVDGHKTNAVVSLRRRTARSRKRGAPMRSPPTFRAGASRWSDRTTSALHSTPATAAPRSASSR
jgi:hypothetical protein